MTNCFKLLSLLKLTTTLLLSTKIPKASGLAAMAATTIVAASVGASGSQPRKERKCCPLCTAAFLPPNDYYGQSSEPAGSSFNW